jgi:hypothetical protein
VVGQRGLAHLLEDRPVALGLQGVLDELLGDGRSALDGLAAEDVLHERAADAPDVDAGVLVEAAILDGDDRVAHVQRDVAGVDDDAALVVGQDAERLAVRVDEHRVLGVLVLLAVLEVRKVGCDGHHHPEEGRDDGQEHEREQDRQQAQLLHARAHARRLGRLLVAEQRRDVRSGLDAHAAGGGAASRAAAGWFALGGSGQRDGGQH